MASTNKFTDLSRPLIVNMGTQNVKYSQPILSTYKLAKQKIENLENNLENNKILQSNNNIINEQSKNKCNLNKINNDFSSNNKNDCKENYFIN